MSLTSMAFLGGCIALVILYYIIPRKYQWHLLLVASLLFYGLAGVRNIIYILITSFTTYYAACRMQDLGDQQKAWIRENKKTASREERNQYKAATQKKRRRWMILCLLINFGFMCTFKYVHFVLQQINAVISVFHGSQIPDMLHLVIPLGISFYTFQTMGYLVDVYWNKVEAQRSYPKVLLFTCFFPQMTQGPISTYENLASELFKEHTFSYKRYSWGAQRMIWGYFKKLALVTILSTYTSYAFKHYMDMSGISVMLAAMMYSVQMYADWTGYMDIVCGLCEIMDIRLTENFVRPYFSKSIAEYWRRWHITLGDWFKNYIYYPIAVARWNQNLGKRCREKFGARFGKTVPASVALVAVWVATGLWHGANWGYIAWGGVNGLFIIFSLWMEPVYASWKTALKIDESAVWWRAFQVIRTFLLMTLIKVLPDVGGLKAGLRFWGRIFTDHTIPTSIWTLIPGMHSGILFTIAAISTALIFITSMIQRRQPIRQWMEEHIPFVLRLVIYTVLLMVAAYVVGEIGGASDAFMYAQF